jgi:Ti-type conjugative transfer relaxase TraA
LAIYHLTASVISRARGQRIVATAAARSATRLYDEQYGLTHNHIARSAVMHAEILAPPGAPGWVFDRNALWNRVEAAERRKDSQLARSIEISLPLELTPEENLALVREYLEHEFVSKGMIADFCIRHANPKNPLVLILLTLREALQSGFGPKVRQWNRKTNLLDWRSAWAERANQHLARAGHMVRIDHRTLEAQHVELAPARRIGLGRGSQSAPLLAPHLEHRLAEQQRISMQNGATILEDPAVAIRALAQHRRTFSRDELSAYLGSRTGAADQFAAALQAVMESPELVSATPLQGSEPRFTSRDLIEAEKSLMRRAATLTTRRSHAGISGTDSSSGDPVVDYLISSGDLCVIAATGPAGTSKLVDAARQPWTAAGFRVICAASSATAARQLDATSELKWRALSVLEPGWLTGDTLTKNDVVIVARAEMVDLKQLERLLAIAERARAKIVLIGDSEQLHAMGATSPLTAFMGPGTTRQQ